MANGYMPRKDGLARAWMVRFARCLGERPEVYKVSAEEVDALRTAVEAFETALATASAPSTRTAPALLVKDEARAAAELACRSIYLRIKVDPTIPDGDKVTAGVRPMNPQRRRIRVPNSAPQLGLQQLTTRSHVISFAGEDSPRRGKPFGATQLQLFRRFKDQPGESLQLVGCYSRGPIRVVYDGRSNGRTVIYVARWMSRRGEVGPWSRALELPVVAIGPQFPSAVAA